ncbi:MAG: amidohydrolase [Pyramidobacter sp.]
MKLIINARVLPVSGAPMDNAAVLVDGTKIAGVGDHLGAPADAEIIDARGLTLTPGLVDAHTHITTSEEEELYGLEDINDMTNPVTAGMRIQDSIYTRDRNIAESREKGGVTTVQTLPGSANVIGGQGAIIKLKKACVMDEMLVKSPSCMKAALGENPIRVYKENGHRTPTTRMGNAYIMRKALTDARNYMEKKKCRKPGEAFETNLDMEALSLVLDRKIKLSVHSHRADDICTAIRIAEEFGLDYTIEHCTEGQFIIPWLLKHHVKAAVGPTFGVAVKPELRNQGWETLVKLTKAGVHTCIITDHPVIPLYGLIVSASLAARAGLTEAEALRCVTLSGAEHLGIEDRVGSIEKGKDADLVLWNGNPLDTRFHPVMTMIDGSVEYDARS